MAVQPEREDTNRAWNACPECGGLILIGETGFFACQACRYPFPAEDICTDAKVRYLASSLTRRQREFLLDLFTVHDRADIFQPFEDLWSALEEL